MFAYSPWPEGSEKTYPKCWYQPVEQPELALKALRFTLSEDITAAIPPGEGKLYAMALELHRNLPCSHLQNEKAPAIGQYYFTAFS